MNKSRIAGFYKLTIAERIEALRQHGSLSATQAERLRDGRFVLSSHAADKMIENVIGVFGLPFAIAPNFIVNRRDCLVPLVVEEPSIVAAVSSAARLARDSGGFTASCDESLLAGQVHITGSPDPAAALRRLQAEERALLDLANAVHPRLTRRGGGVRELQAVLLDMPDGSALIRVHLLVDTVDAMGANLVNTVCEAVAPRIAALCEGTAALRILSNLADRSVVTAAVRYRTEALAGDGFEGSAVRDGIVTANNIAMVDPYRAATHNKGIMNGIDALAVATGNDWRAIEAGAHAYAAKSGRYLPLTRWMTDGDGDLRGEIDVPLKLGTVGGTLPSNASAALGLGLTGAQSASELALLMAAVGLAQNFAALRVLVSSGIQRGHMKLHARSVVAAAGASDECFEEVVSRVVSSGEIKSWKAREVLDELQHKPPLAEAPSATAAGKVILLGEHAVVYGRHALALPVPDAVRATAELSAGTTSLIIPAWGVAETFDIDKPEGIGVAIALILDQLGVTARNFRFTVESRLPRGMGLGSSAAIAVALTRAISAVLQLDTDDERVNAIAFECEKLAHGTPSGVDNTISTFAKPMLFCNDGGLQIEALNLSSPPPIVVACSAEAGFTAAEVAGVRARYERAPARFDALFEEMDQLSLAGAELLQAGNYEELGLAMNICHGLLNAIGVSTPDLERMVTLARRAGAAGAKLTGAGGGGSVVAICPDGIESVRNAFSESGYRTLAVQ